MMSSSKLTILKNAWNQSFRDIREEKNGLKFIGENQEGDKK